MPRPKRIQTAGLIRHVMSRGNGRMRIFTDGEDYRRIVYLLGEIAAEYRVDCWNYCIMPNHYHVTLVPSRGNLSVAIARLNSMYAQWWNKRHGRVGHVFQGRFKDQIVQREGYLMALSRYVVLNPVRAGLVHRPGDWVWSSYRATAGLVSCPAFLSIRETLSLFGEGETAVQQARFRNYIVVEPVDEGLADRIRSNERILGDRGFKAIVRGPELHPAVRGLAHASVGAATPANADESVPSDMAQT